ncbi:hypothetical protein QAD02_018996 [Eretmocerus hayati]|uniref:Uncharacterized protein n=1 Tax=Eretmocerus hayati TaxID=131215 RepID=A0ACC2PIS9_9HYME|nr:hypothetical protein QAD02_018996 [Eretmocerus hayati]
MIFYLLVLAVALTSIFGLVHSQTARDNLHLQRFFEWSVATLEQQFRAYDLSGLLQARNNHAILENVEIPQNESSREEPEIEEIQTTESVEEIEGIRLSVDEDNIEARIEDQEDHDRVLAAITDSLRKLSAAASSGRINGAQLYGALLREALIHQEDRARNNLDSCSDSPVICELPPDTIIASASQAASRQLPQDRLLLQQQQQQQQGSGSNTSCPTSSAGGTHTKSRIPKLAQPPGSPPSPATDKPKMYFGEEPLEYVPHQQR